MKKIIFIYLFLLFSNVIAEHPFNYDLHLSNTHGNDSKVMVVAHGMGGNYTIKDFVKADRTLISFNFPDYNFDFRKKDVNKTSFGTINEILPLLYVIKECATKNDLQEIDLYGFSAGGAAVINAIGVLNSSRYDESLKTIGIFQTEKDKLLHVIQNGIIILDTPLKSIDEIIDFRGYSPELGILAKRYKENDFVPIQSLRYLKGLPLNIIIHFQNHDEILSNRDDFLFIEELKKINSKGTTKVIIGNDGGHLPPHPALWDFYHKENHT